MIEQEAYPSAPPKIKVRLVNFDTYPGDRYLVYTPTPPFSAYLVPKHLLRFTAKDQSVDLGVLDSAEKVYDFSEEIASLVPTVDQIKLALWRSGILRPINGDFKQMLVALLRAGVLPIKK